MDIIAMLQAVDKSMQLAKQQTRHLYGFVYKSSYFYCYVDAIKRQTTYLLTSWPEKSKVALSVADRIEDARPLTIL